MCLNSNTVIATCLLAFLSRHIESCSRCTELGSVDVRRYGVELLRTVYEDSTRLNQIRVYYEGDLECSSKTKRALRYIQIHS